MCLAIVAGKKATNTDTILVGHNEQNYGRHPIIYSYSYGTDLRHFSLPFAPQKHFYAEIPGLHYGDNCQNSSGVMVCGNGCPSKAESLESFINRDQLRQGVGQLMPRLLACYSRSARHAMEVLRVIMERFGYISSGRTFVVADKEEAFIVSVMRGQDYLAVRVPDEAVIVVANTFPWGSWQNEEFSPELIMSKNIARAYQENPGMAFREVYAAPEEWNTLRKDTGSDSRVHYLQEELLGIKLDPKEPQKAFIRPNEPLDVKRIAELLRSHHSEEKVHYSEDVNESAYYRSACNIATQEAAIWDFSRNITFRALSVPCYSLFIPFFDGVDIPEGLTCECEHYAPPASLYSERRPFWDFYDFAMKLERYSRRRKKFQQRQQAFEADTERLLLETKLTTNTQRSRFTKERLEAALRIVRGEADA